MRLNPELLDTSRGLLTAPGDLYATLNAHGLYNSMRFVLRLSPEVHRKLSASPGGFRLETVSDWETAQAMSTGPQSDVGASNRFTGFATRPRCNSAIMVEPPPHSWQTPLMFAALMMGRHFWMSASSNPRHVRKFDDLTELRHSYPVHRELARNVRSSLRHSHMRSGR